jgi:hypothetical protein
MNNHIRDDQSHVRRSRLDLYKKVRFPSANPYSNTVVRDNTPGTAKTTKLPLFKSTCLTFLQLSIHKDVYYDE